MSHMPFILGSYLIATVILIWTALAPAIHKRSLLRQLKTRQARTEKAQ